ncbi:protein kinase 1 [Spodoptera frugiperda multiple nucleopolyhedrovirus]|uniref:non-specific serine/threonine protein kinase n=1 Tax=Spodoptera frugiperda nuclear polyhedrosis virus TaxID=10455 RepID=A1YIZ4_NPVSF|nr:protein kinase 1 [Spodoptera frugiperda multiple nucleopolyhedrovirus]ABM45715.1 protein kinase 1 [Spodoptera frugiperda multiple nucleopolyhedrovirus]AIW01412.1 protein kinase 1 protein [Spodoptera frugiperda multiple nucleopolyhedrovirus]QED40059.1 PK-1 [Spodoptera frugiperda multiple nucleopolyhedrovirus]
MAKNGLTNNNNMDTTLQEITDFYSDLELDCEHKTLNGRYGKLSVWKHKPTQKVFVKKQIKLKHYNEVEPMIHTLMKKNPYYINLYYSITTLKSHVLIMDYIKGGDLFELLKMEEYLSVDETRLIIGQLCEGLHALHKHHYVHNDIKLENVLYNRYKQIYIADYGLCKVAGQQSCLDGTLDYYSPEKILGRRYDYHFDWWAVGIMAYELITGEHPFKGADEDDSFDIEKLEERQQRKLVFKNRSVPANAQSFITGMLKYNLNYRLNNYNDIIKHVFLKI